MQKSFHLDLPAPLQAQLDALPVAERKSLWSGLYRALDMLSATGGRHGHGERVEDLLPPMFILTSQAHRLLYEVDAKGRTLIVRALQRATLAVRGDS